MYSAKIHIGPNIWATNQVNLRSLNQVTITYTKQCLVYKHRDEKRSKTAEADCKKWKHKMFKDAQWTLVDYGFV